MHLENVRAGEVSRKSFLLPKAGHYNRTVVKKGSLRPVTEKRLDMKGVSHTET